MAELHRPLFAVADGKYPVGFDPKRREVAASTNRPALTQAEVGINRPPLVAVALDLDLDVRVL